ncbi:hypothetical protein MNBD_ALPHA05-1310, partial [hydrothermal vent metagenome]
KRRAERDLPGALDVKEEEEEEVVEAAADTDEGDDGAAPAVEPFECPFEEDGETVRDCQLERAVEILTDATAYRQLLADAGVARQ